MQYEIKECGNSLHITLSKKFFKKGQLVEIKNPVNEELTENRIREIVKEEIEKIRTY